MNHPPDNPHTDSNPAAAPTSPFYAAGSFFDVPTMRRVKPLPRFKRRRTGDEEEGLAADVSSEGAPSPHPVSISPGSLGAFPMPPYFQPPTMFHNSEQAIDGGDDGAESRDRDQQGNTKKRKVPAAHHHFRTSSSDNDGAGDARDEAEAAAGAQASEPTKAFTLASTPSSRSKPKLSAATAAGMKLKELSKARRRLVSSVIGSPKPNDLALDLALSSPLKWTEKSTSSPSAVNREKYFTTPRAQAVRRRTPKKLEGPRCTLPSEKFTFTSLTVASDRFKSVWEEIEAYHARFTTELSRLAVKQAETAAKRALAASASDGKRTGGIQRKKVASGGNVTVTPTYQTSEIGTTKAIGTTAGSNPDSTKKKKKRSSKASDPHQIRNYIPSRLPSGTGVPQPPTATQAALNEKNLISPHPLIFLSTEPKPRPRRNATKTGASQVASSLPPVQPADEWICSFCEYNLFYGDENSFRRAIRARKSLLTRRRRARERAAAAASGQGKLLSKKVGSDYDTEEEGLPEEEQEAKFADPAEVDARVAASVTANASRKPVLRDKDKAGGASTSASMAELPPPANAHVAGSAKA